MLADITNQLDALIWVSSCVLGDPLALILQRQELCQLRILV